MLDIGLFFAVLLSGSVFAAARFGRKFEEILPITCMGIVLVLFLFGAVGLLSAGVYALLLAAVCFWAYGLWCVVKGRGKQPIKGMLTPGFVVFCALFALLMLGNYGMLSTGWDDFSHWQLCVRKMIVLDDFAANPASGIYYQSYPPAMALFPVFCRFLPHQSQFFAGLSCHIAGVGFGAVQMFLQMERAMGRSLAGIATGGGRFQRLIVDQDISFDRKDEQTNPK